MIWFDTHIDRELQKLGGGMLPPRRFRRVVQHARSCHRCARLYDRSVRVLRQLENQSAFVPARVEVDVITAMNAKKLGSFREAPSSRQWWGAVVAFAVVCLLIVGGLVRRAGDEPLVPRGRGVGGGRVALRIFCGSTAIPLIELKDGAGCAVGQSLMFAAGAAPPLANLVLQVSGSATQPDTSVVEVTTLPGAEGAVPLTAQLERPGEVEVVAAFAGDPDSARAAAEGERIAGAVILRRVVSVSP